MKLIKLIALLCLPFYLSGCGVVAATIAGAAVGGVAMYAHDQGEKTS